MSENVNPAAAQADSAPDSSEDRKSQARERLLRAQQKMSEMRANGWKPTVLNPVEKAKANPGSLKLAIKAHCWTCSGAGADAGVKFHVRDCRVKNCALHPHRPWQNIKGGLVEGELGQMVVAGGEAADENDDE